MAKSNKKPQQQQEKDLEKEWMELVHEGACCAIDDPDLEKKKAFIKKVRNQQQQ